MNWVEEIFSVPLVVVDGSHGVLTPAPEANLPKIGVSEVFLTQAEEYFRRYEDFSFLDNLFSETFARMGYEPKGVVVDFGSGFGNSVIPLLQKYDVKVVATDISPDLLRILKRESDSRGFDDRCAAVAQDAQNCYFTQKKADLVIGRAVLHHMVRPLELVKSALTVLKPGGKAIFFEPFELGSQILRIAFTQILSEAKRRKETGVGFKYLEALNTDVQVRSFRESLASHREIWPNLDDKWMFCASHFKEIAEKFNCAVEVLPLHDNIRPFSRHARMALKDYGGLKVPEALPNWAWEILREFDEDYFSPDALKDLPIEACVIITAPS